MENASKALIMAGSVLISILIIGALVLTFSQLSQIKQNETNAEDIKKLTEYNKQIEAFNKQLYGSEILSLANLIEDYNKRQSDVTGYQPISLNVYSKKIIGASYIKQTYTSYQNLLNDFNQLEKKVNTTKNKQIYGEKVERLSEMTTEELKTLLAKRGKTQAQIALIIGNSGSDLNIAIAAYQNAKSEMTEFKNKKFLNYKYEYDNSNGRITNITFREQGL